MAALRRFAFAALVAVASVPAAVADVVHLRDGRTVEGLVIEFPDEVEIEGRHGSVRLSRAQIERIEKKLVPWIEYERRLAAMAAGDAEAHYQLAVYCKENGLKTEAQVEFSSTVECDPNHSGARLALGFKKAGNHWLTQDEFMSEAGFVKYLGEWMKPEEAKLREQVEREKRLKNELRTRVAELVEQTGFTDEAVRETAYEQLDQLEPEVRIPVLRAATGHENPAVRMYAILELGKLKVVNAAGDLATRILVDRSAQLREMAVAALKNVEHPNPTAFFQAYFNDGRADVRIRAYAAVTLFPDRRAAQPLLDALEKSLNRREPQGNTVSGGVVTSSDLQGGRFSEPQQSAEATQVISDGSQNIDRIALAETERTWIRKALKACTGFDFGLNLQMWHFWMLKELERKLQGGQGEKD